MHHLITGLVLSLVAFQGCTHLPRVAPGPNMLNGFVGMSVVDSDRSGGRVRFLDGARGRTAATRAMASFCKGAPRVTAERLLWLTGWAGLEVVMLPTTSPLELAPKPEHTVELSFRCGAT